MRISTGLPHWLQYFMDEFLSIPANLGPFAMIRQGSRGPQ
ncbi:hypothetical protein PSTAB_1090 [Stutzerimonas stutzeri]|uniref:Uncharacterized protein n=1 Tax=Stutzerimonas stutzeri (strain ATCC 17588 / DSM 5190 / CCUG 11256 / JCM 5965 / LMG 11199 / NBRC 14165 / NCIMB 11358 / Stanier 221) TaxID=96563 RepID=F8H173_STUS2|nr:hypothetical protein PSTAB_1090 [Stutzerimonas stutzeri]